MIKLPDEATVARILEIYRLEEALYARPVGRTKDRERLEAAWKALAPPHVEGMNFSANLVSAAMDPLSDLREAIWTRLLAEMTEEELRGSLKGYVALRFLVIRAAIAWYDTTDSPPTARRDGTDTPFVRFADELISRTGLVPDNSYFVADVLRKYKLRHPKDGYPLLRVGLQGIEKRARSYSASRSE